MKKPKGMMAMKKGSMPMMTGSAAGGTGRLEKSAAAGKEGKVKLK